MWKFSDRVLEERSREKSDVYGIFQLSIGKFGPTEVRVFLILLNLVMFFLGVPEVELPFGLGTVYDIPIALVAAVEFILFTASSIRDAVELARVGE